MCANTTIGVLDFKCFTSSSIQASCSLPRVPKPPAFRFSTLTKPIKWTPFWSKLYQPAPLVFFPYRSRYCLPSSFSTSCSPGTNNTSLAPAPLKIGSTVSNSSGLERWLISPVCSKNSGGVESPLILSTAAFNVPVTSGLAGLLKPMWLSLICTKLNSPAIFLASKSPKRLILKDFRTPPCITQNAPVPAQAMHSRNPRRSIPSPLWSCMIFLLVLRSMKASLNFLLPCTHPDRLLRLFIPNRDGFYSSEYLRQLGIK